MLFVLNLELLPGEGTNALTSDAQDASGRLYQLKVEHVSRVPGQEWMHAVVLRLDDGMTDALGDVLVRVSLHGMSSNRVRVAVGRAGGGPPDDPGSTPTAAPPTPPNATPTPLPAYGPNEASEADTTRFLEQASWGPTPAEIARVRALGLRAYLNEQFNATPSGYPLMPLYPQDNAQGCPSAVLNDPAYHRNVCIRQNYSMYPLQVQFFKNALYGQDQLRQRVAFALHQILVVSGRDPINQASWLGPYVQILERHAFGNYRQLLREVTLNPAMGLYLDTLGNTRTNPNENFAREILQLFSVGVDELNPDGTPRLDAQGNRVPTYTQETVNNFTRVFTGWTLAAPRTATIDGVSFSVLNFRDPMVAREQNHDTGAKTLLSYPNAPSFNLPPGQTASADLDAALNNIFNHPNVGPFVGRQLIQHLVTGNPSPAYVGRVAAVFNNNCAGLYPESCTGERGDLKATVRAVLLDPEARGDVKTDPGYGKLREPAQYVNNVLRALNVKSFDKTSTSDGVLGIR
ncbi:MAG TPA: DUF1800 domain-containing protein, partial [Pyrinomonadaceae bacterium]|nr:DUF1800 domain-containing protein [Pyrinomonadaceae bacterium]